MISAVIPAFNHPKLLDQTLDTLEQQTLLPDEIILVDDGSDPPLEPPQLAIPLRVIRVDTPPVQRGAAYARNIGVRAANYDTIFMLDSSVLLLPETISSLKNALKRGEKYYPKIPLVLTTRTDFDKNYRVYTPEETADMSTFIKRMSFTPEAADPKLKHIRVFPDHCCTMYKRSTFDLVDGYDEQRLSTMENHDFNLRLRIVEGAIFSDITREGHDHTILHAFHNYHTSNRDPSRREAFRRKWGPGTFSYLIDITRKLADPPKEHRAGFYND